MGGSDGHPARAPGRRERDGRGRRGAGGSAKGGPCGGGGALPPARRPALVARPSLPKEAKGGGRLSARSLGRPGTRPPPARGGGGPPPLHPGGRGGGGAPPRR